MSDEGNENDKSENKKHECNQYEFYATYNQMYVTRLEYFSESASDINENSHNVNETNNLKMKDIALDDITEYTDSDISSIKEEKTEVETTKVTKVDENVGISILTVIVLLNFVFQMKIVSDNTYACNICSKQFDSIFEYQDHQEEHNGQLVFSCTKCDQVVVLISVVY